MDDNQLWRAAIVGAGVALLPLAWRGFCRAVYLMLFAAGRLTRELSARK